MTEISALGLSMIIVLAIPFLWSAVIWILKLLNESRRADITRTDNMEKMFLVLSVLPAVAGLLFCIGAYLFPNSITALSITFAPDGTPDLLPRGPSDTSPIAYQSWVPSFLVAVFGIYFLGAIYLSLNIYRSHAYLRRVILQATKLAYTPDPEIFVTPEKLSPFVSLSGKIVLPAILIEEFSQEQIDLIIAHERAHQRRGDSVYFLLLAIIEILFWYNPFIRLQTRSCRLAAEIACDYAVTEIAPGMRKSYAMAIISTLEIIASRQSTATAAYFTIHRNGDFRMRITEVMTRRRSPNNRSVKALLVLLAGLVMPVIGGQLAYADATAGKAPSFSNLVLNGKITSHYGKRRDPFGTDQIVHQGVDIKADIGTPVATPAGGTIISTQNLPDSYGLLLTIDHGNGFTTRYANLSAFDVSPGQTVKAGDIVARVGSTGRSTGPHLHIEVIKDGNHIDPASVLLLPEQN